jgi:hypothetical protein
MMLVISLPKACIALPPAHTGIPRLAALIPGLARGLSPRAPANDSLSSNTSSYGSQAACSIVWSLPRSWCQQVPLHLDTTCRRASAQHCSSPVRTATSSTSLLTDRSGSTAAAAMLAGYRKRVLAARTRIFGEPLRPLERTGRRALARPLQGPELASWYYLPPRMPGATSEERE